MFKNLTRRSIVRIASFLCAAFLALLGAFLQSQSKSAFYKQQLIYEYQSAFEQLSTSLNNMNTSFEKSVYVGSAAGMSSLAAEILLESGTAKAVMCRLPTGTTQLTTINKYLSQAGDYSVMLSKKAINGTAITEEERDNLLSLAATAETISQRIDQALLIYNDNDNWSENINLQLSGDVDTGGLGNVMTETEESLSDYPNLIYDGPFSDHILDKESVMLKEAEEITQQEARDIAAKALDLKPEELSDQPDEEGKTAAFCFASDGLNIAITKRGGFILYFRKTRDIVEEKISYEDAVKNAQGYLKSISDLKYQNSYFFTDEGVCVINFAYKQGDTICYTDLIKVGVAMDTGEIMFYEARGFIINHRSRTIPLAKLSPDDAKANLSPYLIVNSYKMCLIPSDGLQELHCYEFLCTGEKGEEILVYVNATTGDEERLLILLKTDGGTLTK